MKKLIPFLILVIAFSSIYGQTSFYGKISDTENKPLASANIHLVKNKFGTSSQSSGNYVLQVKEIKYRHDTMVVSYLGYNAVKIPVIVGGLQKRNIELQKQVEDLGTVSVAAKKPKYTALQIVKKARKMVKKNYVNKTVIQEGFYREKFKENGITLKINECAFDFKSTAYPSPGFSKKSFRELNDDYWMNNLRPKIFSNFVQNWPLYITHNDKVNITESRMTNECSSLDGEYEIIGDPLGGPIDVIGLNNIKYELDFFNPKLTDKYQYKIRDIKYIDSALCYVIDYSRIDTTALRYQHQYSKKVRAALFKGEIVIRKSDFAVLSFSSESVNWHNCLNYSPRTSKLLLSVLPGKISFEVDFQETPEGLILKSIKFEANHNSVYKNNSNYKWFRELVLSEPKEKEFQENTIAYFPTRKRTLRQRTSSYNPEFWDEFEKSKLFIPLDRAEKRDLESDIPLSAQFELLNQDVSEIPLPHNEAGLIFESENDKIKDSLLYEKAIKTEDNYADLVLHKLNEYERQFQPGNVLYYDYSTVATTPQRKEQYYTENDSSMNYCYYEKINDSLSKKILNLTYEYKLNKGGRIDDISFGDENIIYKYRYIDELSSVIKVKEKSNPKTLDSIPDIFDYIRLSDTMLVYTVLVNNRPSKLYLHKVGESKSQDVLLLSEENVEYDIELSQTTSKEYIIVDVTSKNQNEVWLVDKKNANISLIHERKDKEQIKLDHQIGDKYYTALVSAKDYRIVKISMDDLETETVISSDIIIDDYYLYGNRLLYTEYSQFEMMLVLYDIESGKKDYIDPQKGSSFITLLKKKTATDSLSFSVQSAIDPLQEFKIGLEKGKYKLIDEEKYAFASQKSNYKSEVLYVKNDDGVEIPVLIYYDKKAIKESIMALLVTGYGAYGDINVPVFDVNNIALLQKGFVITEPAIRGGGINGRDWYYDGKLLNKKNTFNDFIAVTKYLKKKFNLPSKRVFAKGVSAGGTVMGVMANNYSDEFGGIILDRPYLDVYNSMNDSSKYLTTIEYQECGNPNDSLISEYIMSYSPYQNIRGQLKTNLFFRASQYDFITPASQTCRSVLKYRENNDSDKLVLFKTRENQRHMIWPNYSDIAEEYAFMMYIINDQ